ncbi:hypothetical protein QJS04_geneDACA008047 [Acorus gramineus]|uniref:Uncharacterized protein n=1 Tax=Acorus gramineus TaxID=55184 RepID=A0AAV9BCN1_ACOGR|nr:hypothetical protein QJS04_geneDACA008047 [Acorus gramineus]
MASHHHHHHHQNHNQSCCCCSCNSCYSPPPPPPTTTTPTTDPLLHVIATHILQTSTPFKSQQPLHQHHHHQQQQQKQQQQQQQQKQTQLLQSLLTRIAALETSLADLSSSSRSPPPPPKHHHQNPKRPSLKDLAAKTIQTHFRSHLARQSRALRELRVLSAVRSEARALRSSISGGARPEEVSRAAVGLLARLESVQVRPEIADFVIWVIVRSDQNPIFLVAERGSDDPGREEIDLYRIGEGSEAL